jgi:DNA-binding CsgD family transcriptional regulator
MSANDGLPARKPFTTLSFYRQKWYLVGPSFFVAVLLYIHFNFGRLLVLHGTLTFPDTAFIVAAVVLLAAFLLSFLPSSLSFGSMVLIVGGGASGLIGAALMLFPLWSPSPHATILPIGAGLFGVFLICVPIAWFLVLSHLRIMAITSSLLLALPLGTLITWFLLGFEDWRAFWGVLLAVALSVLTLFIGVRDRAAISNRGGIFNRKGEKYEAVPSASLPVPPELPESSPNSQAQHYPYRLYALSFLFSVAFMLSASFWGLDVFHSQLRWDSAIYSLGILIVITVLTGRLTLGSLFIVATPLSIAGVLLALFPEINSYLSESLFVIGFLIYMLFAVILFCNYSRAHEANALRIASLFVFSIFSGCFTGRCIPWILEGFLSVDVELFRLVVAVLVITLLVVLTIASLMAEQKLFSIRFKRPERQAGEFFSELGTASGTVFDVFVAHYSLGAREAEVLALLLQGASATQVAHAMTIATGTAKAHIRHIYEKLDVHNREDLLQLYLKETQ